MLDTPNNTEVFSVSELNRRARQLLETQMNQIRVEGEISNFSQPSSGHWYFTLKDSNAQIRCAMFRNRNVLVKISPKAGDKVVLRARVSIYEARGDYQLIAENLEPTGFGDLQKQFERLKEKLFSEGLFDSERKKMLPAHPKKVAIISSANGAAVHDIVHVFNRRNPTIELHIIPASVQGEAAPKELIHALALAENSRYDAIIIGRGGGSLEDLWAFNNEEFARAIAACSTPVVSAVGHEVDFSISDFVADMRAPTPSAAAELLSPALDTWLDKLSATKKLLESLILRKISDAHQTTSHLLPRLRHPSDKIEQWQQRLDFCERRLNEKQYDIFFALTQKMALFTQRLSNRNPIQNIEHTSDKLRQTVRRFQYATTTVLRDKRAALARSVSSLDIVSPLATLKRGYSVAKDSHGTIIKSVKQCDVNRQIQVQFCDGTIMARTEKRLTNSDNSQ